MSGFDHSALVFPGCLREPVVPFSVASGRCAAAQARRVQGEDGRKLPAAGLEDEYPSIRRRDSLAAPEGIATGGRMETASVNVGALGVDPKRAVVMTRDRVTPAKPDPDLFIAGAERLGVPIERCIVVGDSIWDMMAAIRARALGVGPLSGGYGPDELWRAGAIRVYDDPADLLVHFDEVGTRR